MTRNDIGKNLLNVRERRMWTQGRLAKEAGVSPTTVSGIESGRISNPHFSTVHKLAEALDVNSRELMTPSISGVKDETSAPLTLEWALSVPEDEFERVLENASRERLGSLLRELDEEGERLSILYGQFPRGSRQRWFIKQQIRIISAHHGSVEASMSVHEHAPGERHRS